MKDLIIKDKYSEFVNNDKEINNKIKTYFKLRNDIMDIKYKLIKIEKELSIKIVGISLAMTTLISANVHIIKNPPKVIKYKTNTITYRENGSIYKEESYQEKDLEHIEIKESSPYILDNDKYYRMSKIYKKYKFDKSNLNKYFNVDLSNHINSTITEVETKNELLEDDLYTNTIKEIVFISQDLEKKVIEVDKDKQVIQELLLLLMDLTILLLPDAGVFYQVSYIIDIVKRIKNNENNEYQEYILLRNELINLINSNIKIKDYFNNLAKDINNYEIKNLLLDVNFRSDNYRCIHDELVNYNLVKKKFNFIIN